MTGDRLRKATPAENGYFAGLFFFIPVGFTLLLVLQRTHSRIFQLLDICSGVTLWIACTVGLSAVFFGCIAWSRHVSVKVSLVLAIVAWLILLFLLFGLGYWDFGKG